MTEVNRIPDEERTVEAAIVYDYTYAESVPSHGAWPHSPASGSVRSQVENLRGDQLTQ
jgi:hypothetical protein